jgi:hypothetical protein
VSSLGGHRGRATQPGAQLGDVLTLLANLSLEPSEALDIDLSLRLEDSGLVRELPVRARALGLRSPGPGGGARRRRWFGLSRCSQQRRGGLIELAATRPVGLRQGALAPVATRCRGTRGGTEACRLWEGRLGLRVPA